MNSEISTLFLSFSEKKLLQMQQQMESCLERLDDQQIWSREHEAENSVGNLVLHLCGNMRQWVIAGVGGAKDMRDRDAEFAARGGRSVEELGGLLVSTIKETIGVIQKVTPERLVQRITPQNREVSVLEAIYQVVGHVQQHTGQILFATKHVVGQDLGLTKL